MVNAFHISLVIRDNLVAFLGRGGEEWNSVFLSVWCKSNADLVIQVRACLLLFNVWKNVRGVDVYPF